MHEPCYVDDRFIQDTNLAAILRDYLAQGRQLPGVRIGVDSVAWPSANTTRPTPKSAVNNGGDYVASRRALLNQYVARWLLAFHDQDSNEYAKVLFEICTELAEDALIDDKLFLGPGNFQAEKVCMCCLPASDPSSTALEAESSLR